MYGIYNFFCACIKSTITHQCHLCAPSNPLSPSRSNLTSVRPSPHLPRFQKLLSWSPIKYLVLSQSENFHRSLDGLTQSPSLRHPTREIVTWRLKGSISGLKSSQRYTSQACVTSDNSETEVELFNSQVSNCKLSFFSGSTEKAILERNQTWSKHFIFSKILHSKYIQLVLAWRFLKFK